MEKNNSEIKKKLFVSVPIDLYGILYARNDLVNIDDIVTKLLCEYYGVEFNGNKKKC